MALPLKDLTQHLLKVVPFKDSWMKEAYGPHNTAMNKKGVVERALYCVTPTPDVVKQFKEGGYDILLTHHPYVVGVPQWIAHTALDCTEGGLNDQWRDLFRLKNPRHFDGNLGWYGEIEPTSLDELIKRSEGFVGAPLIGEHHGHEHPIRSIVICTGLGGMVEDRALKTGADCYVLGEATSHHTNSKFKARIEVGHTLSESITGLNFFRKHLEPHGITVDQASLEHDKYSGEVYRKPVYHPYFAEKGLGKPGRTKSYGPAWRDIDWSQWDDKSSQSEPEGEPSEDAIRPGTEEAEFWADYWAKRNAGERKTPVVTKKPETGDFLRPVSQHIQGVSRDIDTMFEGTAADPKEEKPKKTMEKPPMPPGGDFPE